MGSYRKTGDKIKGSHPFLIKPICINKTEQSNSLPDVMLRVIRVENFLPLRISTRSVTGFITPTGIGRSCVTQRWNVANWIKPFLLKLNLNKHKFSEALGSLITCITHQVSSLLLLQIPKNPLGGFLQYYAQCASWCHRSYVQQYCESQRLFSG